MKKILIVSFIIIAIGITLYFIFGGTKNDKNGLKLIGVKKGSIVDKALAVGQIQPRKEIQIKSKISGIVKTLHVDVGQQVKAGDPLITVAPNPTPLEYAEAKRALQLSQVDFDNAQRIFKRAKEMYAKNLISRQEYETDEAQYSQSELKFKLAKEKLELLQKGVTGNGKSENTIVAPIAGTVLEKLVNEGDPVVPLTSYQAGTPLMTLAPMDKLVFKGTVDEIDVGKLSEDMTAKLKIGALPKAKITGVLTKISPKAKKKDNTTLFDIEIDITDKGDAMLRAGFSANADIIINQKDSVLVIPERLLTFNGDSAFVEIRDSTGAIDTVNVQVGLSDGLNIEITKGLALGDSIVDRPPKEIE